jgi:hypothetical protein
MTAGEGGGERLGREVRRGLGVAGATVEERDDLADVTAVEARERRRSATAARSSAASSRLEASCSIVSSYAMVPRV